MSRALSVATLTSLILLAVAGCAAPKGDRLDWKATASDPVLMAPPGTPYDGTGMVMGNGSWTIDTKDSSNAGTVDVDFTVAGHHYVVHWTDFHNQPNQTWEDGG